MSQQAALMFCSCLSLCLCRAEKTCQRGLTSQFLHLSRPVSPFVVRRLKTKEETGEHPGRLLQLCPSYFLSLLPLPWLSVDRYPAIGRPVEVWINLTTAGQQRWRDEAERDGDWDSKGVKKKAKIGVNVKPAAEKQLWMFQCECEGQEVETMGFEGDKTIWFIPDDHAGPNGDDVNI